MVLWEVRDRFTPTQNINPKKYGVKHVPGNLQVNIHGGKLLFRVFYFMKTFKVFDLLSIFHRLYK